MNRYVSNWLAMAIAPIWILSACGDDGGSDGTPDATVDPGMDAQGPDAIPGPDGNLDGGSGGSVLVLSTNALSVDEGGAASFTVALSQAPAAGVIVTIASSNAEAASIDTTSISFDGSNATQPVTVTVTGVDDADAENEAVTLTVSTAGIPDQTVAVTVIDDEAVNIRLSATSLALTEGGAAGTFTVELTAAPGAAVTLDLTSGDEGAVTVTPASLTFDAASFDEPRTVTVSPVDDGDDVDEDVTLTLADTAGDLASRTVQVTVADDEQQNIQILGSPATLDETGTATFGVRLTAAPAGDFTVTIASSDDTAVTATPASITFNAANHDVAQTITLAGVNDADADSERVTITVSDGDDGNDIDDQSISLAVDDNDQRINATPSPLRLSAGASGTISVTMAGQPAADVTISVASGNVNAAAVDKDSLVFTSTNYDVPQTITVTAGSNAGNTAITLSSAGLPNASVIVIVSL